MQEAEQISSSGKSPIVGKPPNSTEVFFAEWGDEIYKRTPTFLNEILRQLLTLSISLMGGSIAFLSDSLIEKNCKLAAVILFFLGMICSFVGIFPFRDNFERRCAKDIRESIDRSIAWKDGWIYGSAVFISLGMLLALVGLFIKSATQS